MHCNCVGHWPKSRWIFCISSRPIMVLVHIGTVPFMDSFMDTFVFYIWFVSYLITHIYFITICYRYISCILTNLLQLNRCHITLFFIKRSVNVTCSYRSIIVYRVNMYVYTAFQCYEPIM